MPRHRTISEGALEHIANKHLWGGEYHAKGEMQNVFAQEIDAGKLNKFIEETAQFGEEVPQGIDYAFDDVTTGVQGQNGIRLFVDEFGNLKSAQPKDVWQ
ncbi:hypothetical protein ACFWN1_32985 [Streptomyces sp. NPDC058459]|uniref:hypothetical protein n=1 Tax=Streptomyces sp. NPDC058459 TaxID=3346508 RepID=UPI003648E42B